MLLLWLSQLRLYYSVSAPAHHDLRKVMRKLGVGAQPNEQKTALAKLADLCVRAEPDCLAAIADAVAIADAGPSLHL
ncbi:hypothetical protein FOA52_010319 [Chlamydomonas sp. UWO 241]|nr:hypothetical protein FOA52_010319 [Chlamydomonas sp. UWO 241]